MHATLTELLENLSTGMLWLSGEGQVRYANARAVARTLRIPVNVTADSGHRDRFRCCAV